MTTKQNIKLCLAFQHFFQTHGGAQLRFLIYLTGLRKRGVETRVLSGTPKLKRLTVIDKIAETDELDLDEILSDESVKNISMHLVQLPDSAG